MIHPQAKTEFEQKILNWIFWPSSWARTKRRPPAWLAPIGRQILFSQISFLLVSIFLIWVLINAWKPHLSIGPRSFPEILSYLIDHPLTVCSPGTRYFAVEVFKWLAVATVFFVVSGFIILRVKNWPLELRLGTACFFAGGAAYVNPIIYFETLCLVGAVVDMIFILLCSVSAIAFLVCSIRIKKWPPEMFPNVEPPIEESNG